MGNVTPKRLAERIAVLEKQLNEPQAATAPPPMMTEMALNAGVAGVEKLPQRRSVADRRAKLTAARRSLQEIRYEIDYWPKGAELQKEIDAALGRLEFED